MIDTITVEQLAERLQVGKSKAQEFLAEIKAVSDTLQTAGMIHIQDYEYWLKTRIGKPKETRKERLSVEQEFKRYCEKLKEMKNET